MNTYWDSFLDEFPWIAKMPLIIVLELFWHYCRDNPKDFGERLDLIKNMPEYKDGKTEKQNTKKSKLKVVHLPHVPLPRCGHGFVGDLPMGREESVFSVIRNNTQYVASVEYSSCSQCNIKQTIKINDEIERLESEKKYQFRYRMYALSNCVSPDEQLEFDKKLWNGGSMIGFMEWISQMWSSFYRFTKRNHNEPKSEKVHKEFDEFLAVAAREIGEARRG